MVRVGGGYYTIDHFIQTFMKNEASKIKRHSVVDRFVDKMVIQKIAATKSDAATEIIPI